MGLTNLLGESHARSHRVEFEEREGFLVQTVSGFVSSAHSQIGQGTATGYRPIR